MGDKVATTYNYMQTHKSATLSNLFAVHEAYWEGYVLDQT